MKIRPNLRLTAYTNCLLPAVLPSEYNLQPKLNHARAAFGEARIAGGHIRRFADLAKTGAVEINVREAEVRPVEDIENLGPELQRKLLCNFGQFIHRKIYAVVVRAYDHIARRSPE